MERLHVASHYYGAYHFCFDETYETESASRSRSRKRTERTERAGHAGGNADQYESYAMVYARYAFGLRTVVQHGVYHIYGNQQHFQHGFPAYIQRVRQA